ncbi:hypothetical protein ABZR86_17665 [Dyella marensis]|uniref:hypothetical protein n=1 Tax=Dyella TaxID=231454 RepID=UPI00047B438D|nr:MULTISPECIES: hypothetical protein [Dyella]
MEYRFPRWISYLLLFFIAAMVGLAAYAVRTPTPSSSVGSDIVIGLIVVCLATVSAWGYLYVSRYVIEVGAENVAITGVFHTKLIPLGSIAQVITVSSPRAGTDSWLLNKQDVSLAKIDGGLIGFDELLGDLGKKLQPYQALFYRSRTWGPWEMQVAGDSKWVPTEAPSLARRTNRRLAVILIGGLLLVIAEVMASAWL